LLGYGSSGFLLVQEIQKILNRQKAHAAGLVFLQVGINCSLNLCQVLFLRGDYKDSFKASRKAFLMESRKGYPFAD
jgi:hypothetical protein